jgi:hypothetical protein
MMLSRLFAVLPCAALLSSCQTASTIVQEPFKLLNSLTSSVSHIGADNDRTPGDASIEAKEAEQAKEQLAQRNLEPAESIHSATASAVAAR